MNPSTPSKSGIGSALARVAFVFGVLFLLLVIGSLVVGATALRTLKPPTELAGLRDDLLDCLERSHLSSIEVTIPAWAATLGRVGTSMTDLDPRIKMAAQTLGGGHVGVYELEDCPARQSMIAMLNRADRTREQNGWTRLVTVIEDETLVAVYASEASMQPGRALEIFAVVLDQQELVIVSARGYTEPMIELASLAMAEGGIRTWGR